MSLEQKNDWEQKIDIKSLELEELTEQLVQMGLPKFRGGQVYSWLHEKRVDSFEQMSNLSAALRQQLAQRYYINSLTIQKVGVQNRRHPKVSAAPGGQQLRGSSFDEI